MGLEEVVPGSAPQSSPPRTAPNVAKVPTSETTIRCHGLGVDKALQLLSSRAPGHSLSPSPPDGHSLYHGFERSAACASWACRASRTSRSRSRRASGAGNAAGPSVAAASRAAPGHGSSRVMAEASEASFEPQQYIKAQQSNSNLETFPNSAKLSKCNLLFSVFSCSEQIKQKASDLLWKPLDLLPGVCYTELCLWKDLLSPARRSEKGELDPFHRKRGVFLVRLISKRVLFSVQMRIYPLKPTCSDEFPKPLRDAAKILAA